MRNGSFSAYLGRYLLNLQSHQVKLSWRSNAEKTKEAQIINIQPSCYHYRTFTLQTPLGHYYFQTPPH